MRKILSVLTVSSLIAAVTIAACSAEEQIECTAGKEKASLGPKCLELNQTACACSGRHSALDADCKLAASGLGCEDIGEPSDDEGCQVILDLGKEGICMVAAIDPSNEAALEKAFTDAIAVAPKVTIACTFETSSPKTCSEWAAAKPIAESLKQACSGLSGTAAEGACSTTGAVGKCTEVDEDGDTSVDVFYSPQTQEKAKAMCSKGTFTALP